MEEKQEVIIRENLSDIFNDRDEVEKRRIE